MVDQPQIVVLGNTKNTAFPPQFVGNLDARSFAVSPIEYVDALGGVLPDQHASGFFYRHDDRVFLVSARHAITGLDAFTGTPFSATAYLPDAILVHPCLRGDQTYRIGPLRLEVRLEGEPRWLQDPEFDQLNTDIACIEVDHPQKSQFWCLNDAQDERLLANVGFDCFIIGYPNRNYHDPYLPVWRRGSFAYEPTMPIHDRPMFLVDAMTSPGMSGSPIVQRWHGPAPVQEADGTLSADLQKVVSSRFIGVYGGRLHSRNEMGQVGYGWYANRIPIIIGQVVAPSVSTIFNSVTSDVSLLTSTPTMTFRPTKKD